MNKFDRQVIDSILVRMHIAEKENAGFFFEKLRAELEFKAFKMFLFGMLCGAVVMFIAAWVIK